MMTAALETNIDDIASDRRRILYMMHVDWRWIKQRPQFLAENLAERHDLHVLYRRNVKPGDYLTTTNSAVPRFPLLPIPWSWNGVRWAIRPTQQRWVSLVARRFRPNTIWLTHPALTEALPAALAELPIVYDCMDDVLGFPASPSRRALLVRLERELVSRAALILCSSSCLCDLLTTRYGTGIGAKISLVRNGVSPTLLLEADGSALRASGTASENRLKVAYFGTIAEWFDFEILLAALNTNPGIEFHLVGPISARAVPRHERLKMHKPVAHEELAAFAAPFDAFIMPFRIGPLTEAVDPVKLYEYLAFGKEVVTVQYKEIGRFSPFVHFYKTVPEFLETMDKLAAGTLERKNAAAGRSAFLAQNTWPARCNQIDRLLAELNAMVHA